MSINQLIKSNLSNFLKPKIVNPFLFPLFWIVSHNLNFLRVKFAQFKLNHKDKLISKELHTNGFVTISNFLDEKTFNNLTNKLNLIKKNPDSQGWFESYNIKTSKQYRPLDKNKIKEIESLNKYVSKISGQPSYAIRNIFDIQSGGLDGNCEFHSDIFRPTYKAWLYIKDVDNFPFEFICGTSRNNLYNFIFHLFCQIKYFYKSFKNIILLNPKNNLKQANGSWRLDYFPFKNKSINKFKSFKIKTFNVPSNTLLIANTHGMHRRSIKGDPNETREALLIDFRTILF